MQPKSIKKLLHFLLEQNVEEEPEYLYHITYYSRLDNISKNGLRVGSKRSIGGAAYDKHSAKGIFLAEKDGIRFWYGKASDFASHNSDNVYEDGLVPVVLRIDNNALMTDLAEDELGVRDSKTDAYIYEGDIEPDYIDVWDGSGWVYVGDWHGLDPSLALDAEVSENDFGEEETLYYFKSDSDNPLLFK